MNTFLMDYFKELSGLRAESENRRNIAQHQLELVMQEHSNALSAVNKYQLHTEFIYARSILFPRVFQQVIICETGTQRLDLTEHLLRKFMRDYDRSMQKEKIIIYTNSAKQCSITQSYLQQSRFNVGKINSDMRASDIESSLSFENGTSSENIVVISGDLDIAYHKIQSVKYIINYDAPTSVNSYVERIISNADKEKFLKIITLIDLKNASAEFHEKYLRELMKNTDCDDYIYTFNEFMKARRRLSFADNISSSESEGRSEAD